MRFRNAIALLLRRISTEQCSGEFELDESCFGGIKKKDHTDQLRKCGRDSENKIALFFWDYKTRECYCLYTDHHKCF